MSRLALPVFVLACDEKKPAPLEPGAPPSAISNLGPIQADAAVVGDPTDPPAPAGDLGVELERFVNVDTCVAERSKLDPLVGDALGAIGYETFLRDACRLLEAAKDKKREICDRIDSSALRARCQSWVAMVTQTPDACPMQFDHVVTRGRNPSCVAIAAKDPRLCAGEPRSVQRGICEAMVWRDPARCEALLPSHRAQCHREVARWRSVLAAPLEGLEKLPSPRAKLVVRGVAGTPDPAAADVDLSADLARGVVVVTGRESLGKASRMRVELGTVAESEAARIAASPQRRPRVGLALVIEGGGLTRDQDPKVHLQKLELELPGEPPIVSPPVACDCKMTRVRADNQRGGEMALVVEGVLSLAGRSYRVTLDIATFVRDVVPESAGARVLPPVHPSLPGLGRADGGAR